MGNNQSSPIIPLIPVLWCYGMPLSCLFGVENCWGAHAFPCKLKRLEESVCRPRLQRQRRRHRQRTGVPPVEFATKQAGIRSTMGERMWAEGREVKPYGTAGARSPARLRFNGSAAELEAARHTPQDLSRPASRWPLAKRNSLCTSYNRECIQDMHYIIRSILLKLNP